jgi:hypothetical protein
MCCPPLQTNHGGTMRSKRPRVPLIPALVRCLALSSSLTTIAKAGGFVSPVSREAGASAGIDALVSGQPPRASGGFLQSARRPPDESGYDRDVWDNFMLGSTLVITQIQWQGGFDPAKGGCGGPVTDFIVAIYPSTADGNQPDVHNPPLVRYQTGGNAGQTPAGTFGGVPMYDYHFTLPAPFQATGGTKYWTYIVASQNGIPDWGLTAGIGRDVRKVINSLQVTQHSRWQGQFKGL